MRWKPGARATKAKQGVYKPGKSEWSSAQITMLGEAGLVYSNPQAVFSSVAMAVPKEGTRTGWGQNTERSTSN